MKYSFTEVKYLETGDWGLEYYQKILDPVMVQQLQVAVKPHAASGANASNFEKVFFPIYPNNEGGIENVRWYKVLDENGVHVFDFLRVEVSAGSFFKAGTTEQCFFLWAGKLSPDSPTVPETADLLKAWDVLKG